MTEAFVAAAAALYGTDEIKRQEADRWLTLHRSSAESWQVLSGVLAQKTSAEAVFLAADTLLKKSRAEWRKLPPEACCMVLQAVRGRLQAATTEPVPPFIMKRLSMALAAMVCRSGKQAVTSEVDLCIGALSAGGATAPAALGVLAALAEETGELDPGSRTELSPVLSGTILKLLPCLAERVSTGVAPQVAEQSAAALAAWLAIMQPASTAATAGPGAIEQACPGACAHLVRGLAVPHVRSSCQDALCSVVRGTAQPSQADLQQTVSITGQLVDVAAAAAAQLGQADAAEDAANALCACAVVASTAVTAVEQLVQCRELVALTQTVVAACASRAHGLGIAEGAVDLLSAINAHSVESRLPELGSGLFDACVQHLLMCAMYPADFTDWDSAEVDEARFLRFRSQDFADLVLQAYELNGFGFMDAVLQQAAGATQPSWQQLEVSAFALHCLTSQLAAELRQASNGQGISAAQEGAARASTSGAIQPFLQTLTQRQVSLVQGRAELRDTVCNVVGTLAVWLAARDTALLQSCALFVVCCIASEDGRQVSLGACKAAVRVVQAWPASMPAAPIAEGLCLQVHQLAQSNVQGSEDSEEATASACLAVNAAARLIGESSAADMERLAPQLMQPLVDTLEPAAGGKAAPERAAHALRMLAAAFQFLGSAALSSNDKRRTLLQLTERCWPLLSRLAASPAVQHADVPEALCDVLTHVMSSAGPDSAQLLQHVMPCLAALFRTCGHSACLAATASIADLAAPGDECRAQQLAHLYTCASGMLAAVQNSTHAAQGTPPDVLAASLTLVSRLAVFHPQHALQPAALVVEVELAMHALQQSERPTLQAATQAFAHLLAPSAAQQRRIVAQGAPVEGLQQLVQQQAPALVRCVLLCLCRTAPQDSWTSLARVLYVLGQTHGESVGRALRETLCDGGFEGIQGTPLTAGDCQKVAQLVTAPQPLPERRFRALISDFAGIAHGVASADDLLAYELPGRHGLVEIE